MSGFYARIRRHRPRTGHGPRRWVFLPYDQLRPDHPLLQGPPGKTGVVYVETAAKPARRPYHKQKLVLLLSAMRHDALERGKRGHPVLYHYSERWYDGALPQRGPAAAGLAVLMAGAVAMHFKVKDPPMRSLPAFVMLALSLAVALA